MKLSRFALVVGFLSVCSVRVAFADAGSDSGTDASFPDAEAGAKGDGAAPAIDGAVAPALHIVGAPCKKSTDCAKGLTCFSATTDSLGSGGPAGGLCTVDCSAHGQADCDHVDSASICDSDPSGKVNVCFELCNLGPADGSDKCHGRIDTACGPSQSVLNTTCGPTCRGDYDCDGRVCDPKTGLCAGDVRGTLPLGAACDPDAQETTCRGECVTIGSGLPTMDNSFCSTRCKLGQEGVCGQDPAMSGVPEAACVFSFDQGEGDGDIGECGELCDCDSDCTNHGFICNPKDAIFGRKGACVPKLTFSGVTPGLPCATPPVADAGTKPEAGTAPDAGGSDGGLSPIAATGGCDCAVGRGQSEPPRGAALALFAAVAALSTRRGRRR